MRIDCIALNCSACCKTYWILLLPEEAKRIAIGLGLGEKDFIEKNCVLLAHLYPSNGTDALSTSRSLLPKKVAAFIEKNSAKSPSFLVLPSVALKRNKKGCCVFLKSGKCLIHNFLPNVCRLFPFIALNKKPLKEVYPFCAALQKTKLGNKTGRLDSGQRKRLGLYFEKVKENGFLSQWKSLPSKGVILLDGEKELLVSKKDFMALVKPLA